MRNCLYCGHSEYPKNAEHVLQRALGGSMTLTEDVCEHCNSVVFPALDTELVRFVRPHLTRTMKSQRSLLRESLFLTYDESRSTWSVARLEMPWRIEVCPQIAFTSPSTVNVICGSLSEADLRIILAKMADELHDPSGLAISERIWQHEEANLPPIHPILVRTARKGYLLVANSENDITRIKGQINTGKIELSSFVSLQASQVIIQQPQIHGEIQRNFIYIERAVVKTAINYLCKILGPDIARCAELYELRTFALKGGPSSGAVSLFDNKVGTQQLEMVFRSACTTDEHALILVTSNSGVFVIQLLEGRIWHVVNLGQVPGAQNWKVLVTTFNPQTHTHRTREFEPQEYAMNSCGVYDVSPEI